MVVEAWGYRELEHIADWELEVWAPDLSRLFEQAAQGMSFLAGVHLGDGPAVRRDLDLDANSAEDLLVLFLSELLWWGESEQAGFDRFDLRVERDGETCRLRGQAEGRPIQDQAKEIKAVTYHRLTIEETPQGYAVRIVFDV